MVSHRHGVSAQLSATGDQVARRAISSCHGEQVVGWAISSWSYVLYFPIVKSILLSRLGDTYYMYTYVGALL